MTQKLNKRNNYRLGLLPNLVIVLFLYCCSGTKEIDDYSAEFIFGKEISDTNEIIDIPILISLFDGNEILSSKKTTLHFSRKQDSIGKNQIIFSDFSIEKIQIFKNNDYRIVPFIYVDDIYNTTVNNKEEEIWKSDIEFGIMITNLNSNLKDQTPIILNKAPNYIRHIYRPDFVLMNGYLWTVNIPFIAENIRLPNKIEWDVPKIDTVFYDDVSIHKNSQLRLKVYMPSLLK